MKCVTLAAFAATMILNSAVFAQSTTELDGAMNGTVVAPAQGQVEVVSNSGHQFIKFSQDFAVSSQAEAEVRLVDGQTGKVTFIAYLNRQNGYQVYEVPPNMNVDEGDQIVIYSPLTADNVATVDLVEAE